MFKNYYYLTKPGIVYGNIFAALAVFLFASRWQFSLMLLFATVFGMALVVASACVFNNWYDRGIDSKMPRTKARPLVSGAISPQNAFVYGGVLGIIGFATLYFGANALAETCAFAGWFVYVFCYTPLKHKSSFALYVGAVAGAMPVVAGYAAGAGTLDVAALILFILMFLWQLPHFWAIAVYRFDEYSAAGVPLSVKKSPTENQKRFARKIFFGSLVVLVVGCVVIALIPFL